MFVVWLGCADALAAAERAAAAHMRRRASQRDSQAPPSCDSSPETPPCGPTHTCLLLVRPWLRSNTQIRLPLSSPPFLHASEAEYVSSFLPLFQSEISRPPFLLFSFLVSSKRRIHRCIPPRKLTVRNKKKDVCSHSRSASNVSTLGSLQSRLSVSEVFSWSVSFGTLLESVSGRRVFMEFLRSEHSDENMLFWLACQELQTQTHHSAIAETAKQIYLDYISILSPKEVSIDASVREAINRSMAAPTAHMFDEAQAQIHALMHRDSYPRFLSSSLYQSLLHGAPAAAPTSIH
ncbi:hypothetical protein JZ751_015474 [Albula glossodonta]|uniref:RGS domain-containing protein n=1 Tax=Albula glossodonta TaxID=121402 RepID=A0A8T2MKC0_9TELE|nr:hypothetical protein JZ751_010233 [Albula glossodonta]KAG9332265.1 hypothetical protein JZ751_015474 [Albula glossodonta]